MDIPSANDIPVVVVHDDPEALAAAAAARLLGSLRDAQTARGQASVVLTGGGIGIATLAAAARSPDLSAVDWARVDVWWGDDRFVPSADPLRNERQAREALLDVLPLDASRVFAMDASDGVPAGDPDVAAARYARALADRAASDGAGSARAASIGPGAIGSGSAGPGSAGAPDVPAFDVLLAGVGPDGHVLSVFPGSPAAREVAAAGAGEPPPVLPGVVAVRDSPKPPPTRVSLTLRAASRARQVWFIVAGAEKAWVVRAALAGADPAEVPAAGLRGRETTLWLVDAPAAAG